jgi:hypothetical protein
VSPASRSSTGVPLLLKAFGAAILVGVALWALAVPVEDADDNYCGRLLAPTDPILYDDCEEAREERQTTTIIIGAVGLTLFVIGWWTGAPPSVIVETDGRKAGPGERD